MQQRIQCGKSDRSISIRVRRYTVRDLRVVESNTHLLVHRHHVRLLQERMKGK